MKKILASILLLQGFSVAAFATHLTDINASNITVGTLDSARLDVSSVTMLGPTVELSEVSDLLNFIPRSNSIIVGTSSARGANIIGTTTVSFGFAVTSVTDSGGDIFIQGGDYFFVHTTTISNLRMIFESSAVVKFHENQMLDTAFIISTNGYLVNLNVDVATSIYNNHRPMFKMESNGVLDNARIRFILEEFQSNAGSYGSDTTDGGLVFWDWDSVGSMVKDLLVSSFSWKSRIGT